MTVHHERDIRIPPSADMPAVVIERLRQASRLSGGMIMGSEALYELINPQTGAWLCGSLPGGMPHWWKPPSDATRAILAERYQAESRVLPVTNNVVTLVLHDAGRWVMQVRGYVSATGKAVSNPGMFSLHGGLMEGDDPITELAREANEELGIKLEQRDVTKLFDFYDSENGRTNHVYICRHDYSGMLALLDGKAGAPVQALLHMEGIGRAFIDDTNLDAAIAAGRVTPISVEILNALRNKLVKLL